MLFLKWPPFDSGSFRVGLLAPKPEYNQENGRWPGVAGKVGFSKDEKKPINMSQCQANLTIT